MRFTRVDAFVVPGAAAPSGNPAAVILLATWPTDPELQAVAAELGLSETAFVVGDQLRWMTPTVEVDLCGHATLATAAVLFASGVGGELRFETRSGALRAWQSGAELVIDLPASPSVPGPRAGEAALLAALGVTAAEVVTIAYARDPIVELAAAAAVRALAPSMAALERLEHEGVVVTARAESSDAELDVVSRYFAPREGIPEDPVTGAAHCMLAPYWAPRLGRDVIRAHQASARGGRLRCTLRADRVELAGQVVIVGDGVTRRGERYARAAAGGHPLALRRTRT